MSCFVSLCGVFFGETLEGFPTGVFGDGKSPETQATGWWTEGRVWYQGSLGHPCGPRPGAKGGGQRPQNGGLGPGLGLHVGAVQLAPCTPTRGGNVLLK